MNQHENRPHEDVEGRPNVPKDREIPDPNKDDPATTRRNEDEPEAEENFNPDDKRRVEEDPSINGRRDPEEDARKEWDEEERQYEDTDPTFQRPGTNDPKTYPGSQNAHKDFPNEREPDKENKP